MHFGDFDSVFAQSGLADKSLKIDVSSLDPLNRSDSSNVSGVGAFRAILESFSNFLLILVPIIAAVALIIAGYFYIFSGADQDNVNKAKTIIKWNLFALLVAFLSGGIIRIIASFLG